MAAAVSLSFGLNHKLNSFEQLELLHNFVAYLATVLADDQTTLTTFIPSDLLEDSNSADGRAFGKPVWDFQYPESSIFIAKDRHLGCAIATTQPGDQVFIALGSTYPMILRPGEAGAKAQYVIRGFAYVDGVMNGECAGTDSMTFHIQ